MYRHLPMALAAAALLAAGSAAASSHREAPFVAAHPTIDGTDFYMFRSYESGRGDYVTMLANYDPLQDAYGGPNYFSLNPNALYEIEIDNNGDGVEDLTFQFRFKNTYQGLGVNSGAPSGNVAIPLINLPPDSNGNPTLNEIQTYTVDVVRGSRRSGNAMPVTNAADGSTTFTKPVDNIGQKSIPNYAQYAAQYVYAVNIPGCSTPAKMFVGQRKEGFVVNLGEVFDLVNLVPIASSQTGSPGGAANTIGDKNITSLALEIPSECLTADGKPAGQTADPVIGAWTTSSLRQARVLNPSPQGPTTGNGKVGPEIAGGAWTQTSRLGNPLVNEVVIGLPDKDKFNASQPVNDVNNFANYVLYPTLPVLLNALFGNAALVPPTPRNDLVAAFLTGVPGVNSFDLDKDHAASIVPAEMQHLNVNIPPTAAGSQNPLGALQCIDPATGAVNTSLTGCDPAGFPNGRRPGDDVVDIELRVAMGALLGNKDPNYNSQNNTHPAYTDKASVTDAAFDASFPYLKTPIPGSPNGANGFPADQ